MTPRHVCLLTGLLLPLLLLSACDTLEHEPVDIEQPEQQPATGTLGFIPAPRGAQLRPPGLSDGGLSERRTNAESAESPYGCIITTLLSEEESDKAYRHRPFYVTFPEETVLEAQGQTEVVALFYTDEHAPARAERRGNGGIVRVARCLVPKAEGVRSLLDEHLRTFGEGSWFTGSQPAVVPPLAPPPSGLFTSPGHVRQPNSFVCGAVVEHWICMKDPYSGAYYDCTFIGYECTQWVWVDDGDPFGGGGGGDGDWENDKQSCLPNPDGTFSQVCTEGGTVDQFLDPCQSANPPAYCSNPCTNTGYAPLEDVNVQRQLEELLWKRSNPNDPNPSNRIEQGAFIFPDGIGGYVVQPIPNHWMRAQNACDFHFVVDGTQLPPGAIWVHTHPHKRGDHIPCSGVMTKYRGHVHKQDRDQIKKLAAAGGANYGIFLDHDGIKVFSSTGKPTLIGKCGYSN